MRKVAKRTAALSAAVVGVALVGSGCSDSDKDKSTPATTTTSSVTSSGAAEAPGPATESGTATESAEPSTTTMAGADGTEYTVSGPVLEKYDSLDDAAKTALGQPKADQQENPDGGVFQEFDDGVIVHKGKSYVVWGAIRDKWNELGGSQGELGYPTSDETDTADGGKQTTFQHGTITWKPGEEATVTKQ
jgi:uncharacterized protein with LGFP repeats